MDLVTWWTNAVSGKRTTIGGILTALLPALLLAKQQEITPIPDWLMLIALIGSIVGPIVLGTQARQGNVTSETVQMYQEGIDKVKQKKILSNNGSTILKSLIFLTGVGVLASGCGTLAGAVTPFGNGFAQPSKATVTFEEKTAAGDVTKIKSSAQGEASTKMGVQYTGATTKGEDVVTPWILSVMGDNNATSPQSLVAAQGYAKLLEETPSTIAGLADQIGAISAIADPATGGPVADSIKQTLIKFVIQRFTDRKAGLTRE